MKLSRALESRINHLGHLHLDAESTKSLIKDVKTLESFIEDYQKLGDNVTELIEACKKALG